MGRVGAVPRLCELYSGICLTTEEKARKNLSQGSRRVPVGTMKTNLFDILTSRINHMHTDERRIKEKTPNVSLMCV